MTEATLNGQIIGQTERATRAVLDRLLETERTSFERWVTMHLLATRGAMSEAAVIQELVFGLRLKTEEASAVVESARREGLLAGSERLELTDAGSARHRTIVAGVERITKRLYDGLPREDLVVARRVLETLTARARAELFRPNGP